MPYATIERLGRSWLGFTRAADRLRRHVVPALEAWAAELGTSVDALLRSIESAGPRSAMGRRFVSLLTVCETYFYRHGEQLQALVDSLAPTAKQRTVHVWCAACSIGPEVWTLAMLCHRAGVDAKFWATDIDTDALAEAEAADAYQDRVVQTMPRELKSRYLRRGIKGWKVDESLRPLVDFAVFNLVESTPPSARFDAVICRNVLIYFEPDAASSAVRRLLQATRRDGQVVLGVTDRLNVPRHALVDPRLAGARRTGAEKARAVVANTTASADALRDEVGVLLRRGDFHGAEERVSRWCAEDSRSRDAQVAAACVALHTHEYCLARVHLQRARALAADDTEVCYLLGVAAFKEQDYPAAAKELRLAAGLDRTKWYAALLLAMTERRLDEPARERRALEQAIAALDVPSPQAVPQSVSWVASAHDSSTQALAYARERLHTVSRTRAA